MKYERIESMPLCTFYVYIYPVRFTHCIWTVEKSEKLKQYELNSEGVWILDEKWVKPTTLRASRTNVCSVPILRALHFGMNGSFFSKLIYDFSHSTNEVICIKIWIKWVERLVLLCLFGLLCGSHYTKLHSCSLRSMLFDLHFYRFHLEFFTSSSNRIGFCFH